MCFDYLLSQTTIGIPGLENYMKRDNSIFSSEIIMIVDKMGVW